MLPDEAALSCRARRARNSSSVITFLEPSDGSRSNGTRTDAAPDHTPCRSGSPHGVRDTALSDAARVAVGHMGPFAKAESGVSAYTNTLITAMKWIRLIGGTRSKRARRGRSALCDLYRSRREPDCHWPRAHLRRIRP